ncbi:MAG: hypothetical protein ACRDRU_15460 [Pseudonocardiaceae bacterium]
MVVLTDVGARDLTALAAAANLADMESLITGPRARGHQPLFHDGIAESFQAWRRAQPDLGEELVDVARYLFALAEMNRHTPRRCWGHGPQDC